MFVNGDHGVTNTWDIGNPDLGLERARNAELGLGWRLGPDRAQLQTFAQDFGNYIGLMLSNASTSPPTFRHRQIQARFRGVEGKADLRFPPGARRLDLALRGDVVRADDLSTGELLPRIAPMRIGATLILNQGPWSARLGGDHHATQERVPAGQRVTGGHTLWHTTASYRTKVQRSSLLWFALLDKASNVLACSASSILTQSAPGQAPLPGRSLRTGLQLTF
ncbi:MAG: TonB-dependent receptor [Curvibacter sp.]|jgi:iron complex outermembrane receptor protein